jgi:hypothetical protein
MHKHRTRLKTGTPDYIDTVCRMSLRRGPAVSASRCIRLRQVVAIDFRRGQVRFNMSDGAMRRCRNFLMRVRSAAREIMSELSDNRLVAGLMAVACCSAHCPRHSNE